MNTIHAESALLPSGWARDVSVSIDRDGRIVEVTSPFDTSVVPDHKADILLSAPVNVHSHAFQRAMAGLTEKRGSRSHDSFWTWRQQMFRFLDRLTPDHVEAIAAFVQMEMLEAGYATNVEFHYLHHGSGGVAYDNLAEMSERVAAAAAQTGISLTLLPVLYTHGGCDGRPLGPGQIRFGNDLGRFARLHEGAAAAVGKLTNDCRLGAAPHSLRAVAREDLAQIHSISGGGPIHMHLAEQAAEVDEIKDAWGQRPVEWVLEREIADSQWCMIHCTQMQPHETEGLARTGAVAGLCPITESSLGDGIFDGLAWVNAGGRMAIGSDSNIRISLTEELRTLEYSQRLRDQRRAVFATKDRSTARRLLEEILQGGAQAAGRNCGAIESGRWADLLALDASHVDFEGAAGDTVLDTYVFAGDDRLVADVWSAGRHLVQQGHHVSRASIVDGYCRTMQALKEET